MKKLICLLLAIITVFSLTACFRSENKYEYSDMSKYITLPSYLDQTYDINLDAVQQAIDTYLIKYATEYTVRRGDRINVDLKFYKVDITETDDKDVVIDTRGEEITELSQLGIWIEKVGSIDESGNYRISSQIENGILGSKIKVPFSKKYTLGDDFFKEEYRGQEVFLDIIVNNVSLKPGLVANTSYTGYHIDENGAIIQENGKDKSFDESDSAPFFLGSHLALDEIEEGLIGMSVDETRDINATFPDDYAEKSLAGKKVMFRIKIKGVFRPATYDDSFTNTYFNFKTTKEFEEALKEKYVLSQIYEYINENVKIHDYPKSEYRAALEQLELIEEPFAEQNKVSLEDYIKKTYDMTIDEYIKSNMATEMIFYTLRNQLRAHNIEPTENELKAEKEYRINEKKSELISQGAPESAAIATARDFIEGLGESYIYELVLFDKIDNLLPSLVNTQVVEKTYTSISEAQEK